jgi:protein-tyrosine phosphatase
MRSLLLLWLLLVAPALALPNRKVVLQRAPNVRELGGIELHAVPLRKPGSRRAWVRHGMVYRSGALCSVTSADVATLKALHIHTIIDFRFARELKHAGLDNAALRQVVHYVSIPIDNSYGLGRMEYRHMVRGNDGALRAIFELLSKRDTYPVLYHCAGGKDRTGMVTALLLDLLGANRSDIMADYLLSRKNKRTLFVKASWINEVFKEVDRSGGIDSFLWRVGVSAAQLQSIRNILVDGPK